jgi:hypothetical protein
VSHEATLGENELSSEPVDCCGKQCDNKSSMFSAKGLSEMLLLTGEEEATTKGEYEAVVAELCGITSVSHETSDWDNNASMTEADSEEDCSGHGGATVAEDNTPTELVSIVGSMWGEVREAEAVMGTVREEAVATKLLEMAAILVREPSTGGSS